MESSAFVLLAGGRPSKLHTRAHKNARCRPRSGAAVCTMRSGAEDDNSSPPAPSSTKAKDVEDTSEKMSAKELLRLAEMEIRAAERRYAPKSSNRPARLFDGGGRDSPSTKQEIENLREQGIAAYNALRAKLFGDTVFLGALGMCATSFLYPWKIALSYGVGVGGSLLYVYLLSRTVDRIAVGARAAAGEGRGAGGGGNLFGSAKLLLVGVLAVGLARNQERLGLSFIPAAVGFITYKLAIVLPAFVGEETMDV